ncbi:MAG TPA: OmpA family protein [Spirochaetota bacterium]|nr:OmpA family protein [Spirochaetota bacterium]
MKNILTEAFLLILLILIPVQADEDVDISIDVAELEENKEDIDLSIDTEDLEETNASPDDPLSSIDLEADLNDAALTNAKPLDELDKFIIDLTNSQLFKAKQQQFTGRKGRNDSEKLKQNYQDTYMAQNYLIDAKNKLLHEEYSGAEVLLRKAHQLRPGDKDIKKILALLDFPEIKITTAKKIFSLKAEKYIRIKLNYNPQQSSSNWIKKWHIKVMDEYNKVISTLNFDPPVKPEVKWDGKFNGKTQIDEGVYQLQAVLSSDWNCRVYSGLARFTIDNTPPKILLQVKQKFFIPGEETVYLNFGNPQQEKIASWKLIVKNSLEKTVFTRTGSGNPASRLKWDGRDNKGNVVSGGEIYTFILKGKDTNKNKWESNKDTIKATIKLSRKRGKLTFDLNNIQFDVGKAVIKKKSRPILQMVADLLKEKAFYDILITGHTDSQGSRRYNEKLSRRRARAVKNYLIHEFKLDPGRVTSEGKGESEPIADNDTAAGRAKNRRVEFELVNTIDEIEIDLEED